MTEETNMNNTKSLLDDILDTELTIYSYVTTDNVPGTIIINSLVNPKLKTFFDDNSLFMMEDVKTKQITLRNILESGIVSVGSTDLMETINISYPDQRICSNKPTINGLYMHGSRRRLIAEPLGEKFIYDPESDHENFDFDDDLDSDHENLDNDNEIVNKSNKQDMSWLCN